MDCITWSGCILKVKVFRIKDFHFRMVQEVAQILLHILALLGFAESWYSAEAVARAECPAVTM